MTSAASWRSEDLPPILVSEAPKRQRSVGRLRIAAAGARGRTHLQELEEQGALRGRLPRSDGGDMEAVIVNTSGGVACGDRFAIEIEARDGARLTVSTPAAEKVYRSDADEASIHVRLVAGHGAALHWLPQETILFDQARLTRRYEVDLAPESQFLAFEALVLGRAARGEVMKSGALVDQWRVRRGGGLIYADALRLDGAIDTLLTKPAIANGRHALATLLYVAPDAEARLDAVRAALESCASECGASAWNGLLVVRWLAADSEMLRRDATSFLMNFRGAPLPRVWAS
ncbi:urease accessory protein UreD [Roseixanthobacter glucoisosaccharinicivorans]|uniref:urease accessory protein UreD n=1 Tax=Roseixanthobacter glucoisosaccharinicivorans TaxID=3119923 RepID=UPI00372D3F58